MSQLGSCAVHWRAVPDLWLTVPLRLRLQTPETLPEHLIGTIRLDHVDLKTAGRGCFRLVNRLFMLETVWELRTGWTMWTSTPQASWVPCGCVKLVDGWCHACDGVLCGMVSSSRHQGGWLWHSRLQARVSSQKAADVTRRESRWGRPPAQRPIAAAADTRRPCFSNTASHILFLVVAAYLDEASGRILKPGEM